MKTHTMTVRYCEREQTIKGYLSDDKRIFVCKGNSFYVAAPWYAFDAHTGKCLADYKLKTRQQALEKGQRNIYICKHNQPKEWCATCKFTQAQAVKDCACNECFDCLSLPF